MGDPVAIHRPRASPTLPSSQNDLVIEILELYLVDPAYAMIGPPDTWSGLLSTTSSLGLGPSPGAVRDSAGKCNIRLIQAMAEEDETSLTGCGNAMWVHFHGLNLVLILDGNFSSTCPGRVSMSSTSITTKSSPLFKFFARPPWRSRDSLKIIPTSWQVRFEVKRLC